MSAKAEHQLKPWCPFCGLDVGRPSHGPERKLREFPLGVCECGALYVADATGHNVGAAMVDCLVSACDGNWDLAWDLVADDDYLTAILEDYDEVTHQVVQKRNLDGRAVRGVLYFVRLHHQIAELVRRAAEKKQAGPQARSATMLGNAGLAAPAVRLEPLPDPKRTKQKANKELVCDLAQQGDISALVALYLDDRRTLRFLQRLLYEPEPGLRYRLAWILGQVCGRGATRDPGPVADLLHRLFEACADSASSSWGMVEAIGAIIAARPDLYGAFSRHLFAYMGDPGTREAVLWGLAHIAAARPDLLRKLPFYSLFPVLQHQNAVFRGLTARILGRMRAKEANLQIMALQHDPSPLILHENGQSTETTVGALATEALAMIHEGEQNDQ